LRRRKVWQFFFQVFFARSFVRSTALHHTHAATMLLLMVVATLCCLPVRQPPLRQADCRPGSLQLRGSDMLDTQALPPGLRRP
jgi:hypothetical protein